MSSLGLSQWFSGLLPGTESESSKVTSELPKKELAVAVARSADAIVRNFILCYVVGQSPSRSGGTVCLWKSGVS